MKINTVHIEIINMKMMFGID